MMGEEYTVYMHRNKINGMCYVGQTKLRPVERWWNGSGYRAERGNLLGKAIQEFGWDAFEHIILETGLTKEVADEAERKYTKEYNSITPYGYNTDSGGRKGNKKSDHVLEHFKGRATYVRTEDIKRKMSEARKRKWEDPEYRASIEKHLLENSKMIAANKEKYYTEERRKKMSETSKRMWAEADDEKRARMLNPKGRGCCNEQDEGCHTHP